MHVDDLLARRIRAAVALAGMSGIPELAKNLPANLRLGQDTLYDRLGGKSELKDHEYEAIVAACEERGVPRGFFTFDLATLGAEQNGQADFERRLRAVEEVSAMVRRDLAPLAGLDAARLERLVAADAQKQLDKTRRTTTRKRPKR